MICDVCGRDRPDTKLYATEWDDVACCAECGGALKEAWDEMTPEQQAATLAEGQGAAEAVTVVTCDLCGAQKPLDEVLVRRWTPENKAITLGFKQSEILCLGCAGGRSRTTDAATRSAVGAARDERESPDAGRVVPDDPASTFRKAGAPRRTRSVAASGDQDASS